MTFPACPFLICVDVSVQPVQFSFLECAGAVENGERGQRRGMGYAPPDGAGACAAERERVGERKGADETCTNLARSAADDAGDLGHAWEDPGQGRAGC